MSAPPRFYFCLDTLKNQKKKKPTHPADTSIGVHWLLRTKLEFSIGYILIQSRVAEFFRGPSRGHGVGSADAAPVRTLDQGSARGGGVLGTGGCGAGSPSLPAPTQSRRLVRAQLQSREGFSPLLLCHRLIQQRCWTRIETARQKSDRLCAPYAPRAQNIPAGVDAGDARASCLLR